MAVYNNTLTLATKEMKFGINEEVNRVKRGEPKAVPKTIPNENSKITVEKTTTTTTQGNIDPGSQPGSTSAIPKIGNDVNVLPLLGSAITLGFLVAKYVI